MDSVIVRPITPNDYSKIGDIIIAASLPYWHQQKLSVDIIQELSQRYDEEGIENKVGNNPFFVAEELNAQKLVGVIGLRQSESSEDYNQITTFFIDPNYQGKGIGRILYEKVKEEAVKRKYDRFVVSSSPNAEKIYEHLGFKKIRVDSKEYENGTSHYEVWMEQLLNL